ncbi:hypothetical protein P2318_28435 [Myxococcaceae bacterium GXIMD 01537]
MKLQNGLLTLALSAMFLAPVAAQAADTFRGTHEASPVAEARRGNSGYHPAPVPPQPARPARQKGHYELRTVTKQVAGHYEQVWVAQMCKPLPRRNATRCEPGHYERRWVPASKQTLQEWVWVSARDSRYGRG